LIEAVLALPELEGALRHLAEPIVARHPHRPPVPVHDQGEIFLPNHLPHYSALGGEHPIFRQFLDTLAPLRIYRPDSYGTGLLAAALAALLRAQAAAEALLAAGIEIDRADAASYVAARFPCLLTDQGNCDVEMQWHLPNSLGERPFFIRFDFMPMMFLPFAAAEHMNFPEQDPGIHRILRQQLESPACLGIITHARDAARQFADIFESPAIEQKCTLINLPSDIATGPTETGRQARIRGHEEIVTLFFAASAAFTADGFFARGGVDVLNAFADLSEEFDQLCLILRGQLPAILSPRLVHLARKHPRIQWVPDRLSQAEHEDLLHRSDIFVMPSIGIYRNGLTQALRLGLVPVVSGCFYAENFIEPLASAEHRGALYAAGSVGERRGQAACS
jgi:glycosyltransferase involved in cell wall biosynthesis